MRALSTMPLLVVLATLAPAAPALADDGATPFVREVLARNPGLAAQALRRDSVRLEARSEGLWPDPVASVMLDNVPGHEAATLMPMVRLQVNQMLPWPGKLALMRSSVEARADAAGAAESVRRLDLALEARRGFWMLAANARHREINRAAYGLVTVVVDAAAARYGSGRAGHHELARAEVERDAIDVERVELDGERASVVAMMNALRDMPVETPIADPPIVETPPRPIDLPEALAAANESRPELRAMAAMRSEDERMAALARRERYPDLMVGVWFNQMMGEPSSAGAMLGATIPVFGVARQDRRAGALDLRSSSTAAEIAAMRAMIRFEVASAARKVETAERTLAFMKASALPRARESFESSLAGYAAGTAELVGVLDARRAVQTTERAFADAVIVREVALAELDRAVGVPPPGESRGGERR